MKIYNTLTKQKEEFVPIEPNKVKMYVCGPTVYNLIHIGNARPYIFFDVVRRYFEATGYDVNYVQNFTDVDDKIIKKANEEGKSTGEIVDFYIKETLADAKNLNVNPATCNPRVTEEMPEIIEMIEQLIEKGFAYEVDGTVYFSTNAFDGYGKLSKKVLEELEAGARIEVAEVKRNPFDFVLWKPKKEGEPYWESPWGQGRPGWHIECSAMSKKYLGKTIDIHAGGEDLVFPHHENEIAQSEAVNGVPFSNYWMHNSFLNIDNQKMSKSLGNFKTLRDVGEAYGYDVVRFFMLASAHYRSPLNFSGDLMEASKNGLDKIKNCIDSLEFAIKNIKDEGTCDERVLDQLEVYEKDFHKAMENDFNTAEAMGAIFELVKFANFELKVKNKGEKQSNKANLKSILQKLNKLIDILGLIYEKTGNAHDSITNEEIEKSIEERKLAKKAKDFAKADEIRNYLASLGVEIKDTREGVHYKRV
ncbi:cysteine--tRNA ligase [Candidatus Epulonipiscium fishelsonii]|uniref:Cysteine--tRNA ligase n=1 Tax=Candidatus Epulonipiscium fishelsonii TaxID=77094 RepID=A0ACC8XDW4_9FIRM|nr:cysteine--tRNA ligase [Epulopiscium sp. SCG-B05WGA-EpuloA1]ONI41094.1 cysteine--tRNA ligase [Epulopiscium sp. SCG-B11WGA-EpuloA1]